MMKHLPNIITSTRIIFSLLLVFSEPLSISFWVFYGLGAATDLIDGPVARKLKVDTKFGPTFDAAADFFFIICIMICVFPILEITILSYILIGAVFLFKAISVMYAYRKYKSIVSYHTYFIKLFTFLIAMFPLWILFLDENLVILILAILMVGAYIEELFITRISDEADANAKSLYHQKKHKGAVAK